MPIDIIPFTLPSTQRATGTGDRRMVNALSEAIRNPLTKEAFFNIIKRPCLANSTQPPAGAATGRGLYAWGATGKIYSVFANKIYSGVTDLSMTFAGSSGRVWFAETPADFSAQLLVVSDGADNYNITTGDVATQIDQADNAYYPQANLGPIVFIDGYLLQAQSNGRIWNWDLNSATSIGAASFLTADTHGGALEAIHKQKDQVLGFTKNRIEFFFNNGGSPAPLLRIDQNTIGVGLAAKGSLAWSGEISCFVTENSADGSGGRSVMMIISGKAVDIGTPVINRFLNAEGTSISTCTAWMERVAGQLVYVLNLSSADRSFVYNLNEGQWDGEWEDADGGNKFNGISATSLDGTVYIQDAANGRIYTFPTTTFQDSGTTITVTLQTEGRDQGTRNRKFVPEVELVGDTQSSGTATLLASDNDYSSFTTIGTFDLTQERKVINRCGSYVGKRAWRVTHAQNTAFRAQALRVNYEF